MKPILSRTPFWLLRLPSGQARSSANVQWHVIAVHNALYEAHPLGDEVVELFDEDPTSQDVSPSDLGKFHEKSGRWSSLILSQELARNPSSPVLQAAFARRVGC